MGTTSTDSGYYWYLRVGPKVNTVGLVNEDGDAVDSALTVELHTELADVDQDFDNNAEFLLPEQYIMKFAKGVLGEYLHLVHGQVDPSLMAEFEAGKVLMRGLNRAQKYAGDYIKPNNMRSDQYKYNPVRSENT